MSYQIEPEEVHKHKPETKRQSLYHYIRHASKMMKIRGDIRRHKSDICWEQDVNEKHAIEEDIPSYYISEKSCDLPWSSQLAFPSVLSTTETLPIKSLSLGTDDEEDLVHQQDQAYTDSNCYSATMQKLCGVSLTKDSNAQNKTNTAVLITLSPVALAAANAARQRRLKTRNTIAA